MKTKVRILCGCQQPLEAEVGMPSVVNLPGVSMIVFEHPTPVACTKCGAMVCVAIAPQQNLSFALMALPAPAAQAPLIIPPGAPMPPHPSQRG